MKHILTISTLALLLVACGNTDTPEARQKKIDRLTITINKMEKQKQMLIEASDTVQADKIYAVKVQILQEESVDRIIAYTANLLPWEEVYMAPASPGRVEAIFVEVGDRVKKGDLLAKMDQTQLNQAKIQLAQLKVDFERMKALRESNSISAQQFDQIKTQLDVTQTNVDFLEENTRLLAPFDGVITGRYFENGELYSGAPSTQAGKAAVLTLQQIDPLKALVNVSEKYYPEIRVGSAIDVVSDIYPDEHFSARIERIYPTIDPLTRSFKVEVKVANSSRKLRPGMYARTTLKLGESKAIVVPAIAVLQQEGTNNRFVFVNRGGVAERVDVTLGNRFNDKLEVISDRLAAGDPLIVAGQAILMNGVKVSVSE